MSTETLNTWNRRMKEERRRLERQARRQDIAGIMILTATCLMMIYVMLGW